MLKPLLLIPKDGLDTMRIVQITDLHVGHQDEDTYGVDVRANFLQILEAARKRHPAYLVLSGDLCYRDGDAEVYHWIRQRLEDLGIPYEIMSGNHDDPVLMAQAFGREQLLKNRELYFVKELGGRPVVFLDTTSGVVSLPQQEWLRRQLQALDEEAIVFMHHPPIDAGVPFMDTRYALRNQDEVLAILSAHPYGVNVFSGHYHVEKIIRQGNVVAHITPSCFFQIAQQSEEFQVDHYRIAFREIDWENGVIMNAVHYLEGNRQRPVLE